MRTFDEVRWNAEFLEADDQAERRSNQVALLPPVGYTVTPDGRLAKDGVDTKFNGVQGGVSRIHPGRPTNIVVLQRAERRGLRNAPCG